MSFRSRRFRRIPSNCHPPLPSSIPHLPLSIRLFGFAHLLALAFGAATATFRRHIPSGALYINCPSLSRCLSCAPCQPELGCCSSLSLSTYFPAQRNFASESKAILVFSVNLIRLFNDSISLFDNLARSNCTSWVLPPFIHTVPYRTVEYHTSAYTPRSNRTSNQAESSESKHHSIQFNSIRFIRTKTVPGLVGSTENPIEPDRIFNNSYYGPVLSCLPVALLHSVCNGNCNCKHCTSHSYYHAHAKLLVPTYLRTPSSIRPLLAPPGLA